MSTERNPNGYIRGFVEEDGNGWKYRQTAADLYQWTDVFRYYFFAASQDGQTGLAQPLLAIEEMRHDVYAAYRLTQNPNGLPYEILMNARWLSRPHWEIYETLLHEMVHLYQETTEGMEKCKGGYHNKQFVEICNSMGLWPRLGHGSHWRPADGQYERLMERYGIPKPESAQGDFGDKPDKGKGSWWDVGGVKTKGSSTLRLYICSCEPPFKVRSGRPNLAAVCLNCMQPFTLQE